MRAPRQFQITVLPEDIEHNLDPLKDKPRCNVCPIARAVNRILKLEGEWYAGVGTVLTIWRGPIREATYMLPPAAVEFILKADNLKNDHDHRGQAFRTPLEPITFVVSR